jgi:hypothetical protein
MAASTAASNRSSGSISTSSTQSAIVSSISVDAVRASPSVASASDERTRP